MQWLFLYSEHALNKSTFNIGAPHMKLTYRGIAYQFTPPSLEVTSTDEEGTFLGARFNRKHYHVDWNKPKATPMIYRGVRYTR